MSEISEFTEIKNDGACDGLPANAYPRFDIQCPECGSNNIEWDMDKGCYVCYNCNQEFITEKFAI